MRDSQRPNAGSFPSPPGVSGLRASTTFDTILSQIECYRILRRNKQGQFQWVEEAPLIVEVKTMQRMLERSDQGLPSDQVKGAARCVPDGAPYRGSPRAAGVAMAQLLIYSFK